MWNPYLGSKPVGVLKGHTTQVTNVVAISGGRLASLSSDMTLMVGTLLYIRMCRMSVYDQMVYIFMTCALQHSLSQLWDLREQYCITTIISKVHGIYDDIDGFSHRV